MVADPFNAGRDCSTEKEVIVSHLVLVLAEMKEWVGDDRVVIEGQHHELLWEADLGDFPR